MSFRTSDLALATYLNVKGHGHQSIDVFDGIVPPRGTWVFPETPAVFQEVSNYRAGHGLVEPKMFTVKLGEVRGELYRILDDVRNQPHSSVSR